MIRFLSGTVLERRFKNLYIAKRIEEKLNKKQKRKKANKNSKADELKVISRDNGVEPKLSNLANVESFLSWKRLIQKTVCVIKFMKFRRKFINKNYYQKGY